MYQQIKQLAEDALALQNKNAMDAALCKISALCTDEVADRTAKTSDGLSSKALWPATKEFFDAKFQNEPASAPSSTGLVHVKMEGCAVHPDDIGATMNEEQYARQLAAHERDVAAGGPADDAANTMAEVAGVVNRKPGKKGASK